MTVNTLDPSTWRLQTAGGIPYKLIEGFPTISGDAKKVSGAEQYIIRASDLEAFYLEAIPAPTTYLGSVYWPDRRRMPGVNILVTKDLNFSPYIPGKPGDPFGTDGGATTDTYSGFYKVAINYETIENQSDEEQDPNEPSTFLEHSVAATAEFLSIPPEKTETTDDQAGQTGGSKEPNADRKGAIIKLIPTIEHTLKWENCLAPNWERIVDYLGTINDRTFDLLIDANKHTVLFMGVNGQQSYVFDGVSQGVQPWSLDFRFSQRAIKEGGRRYGWNHVYSPKYGEWRQVYRANGALLYEDNNLEALFTA